jgi:probable H4MPT-linked C1 transfer pathway protein
VTVAREPVLGWDIGGANIKVARIDGSAAPAVVVERPFPLWRERDRLPSVLAELADRIGRADEMAVTMTAELADCFATKREGVAFVLDAVGAAFPSARLQVFGVDGGFRTAVEAHVRPNEVAAANWMATAVLAARRNPDAIVIDVGSTTTDIVPIVGGRVAATGRTDRARLQSGELVYTGCLRTPIAAIIRSVPLANGCCRVAAEHFSVAADAYRWLGRMTERDYTCETPDGRGRSRLEAGARLARMVCADSETLGDDEVTAIAAHVARAQTRQIAGAIRQVTRRLGRDAPCVALVAGSGAFLGRAAAERSGLAACEPGDALGGRAGRAAPAVAVACLLWERLYTGVAIR